MDQEHEQRRVKSLDINPEVLINLFRDMGDGDVFRVEGVPGDARVVGASIISEGPDPWIGTISLNIESESFDPVEPGKPIPQMDISLTRVDRKAEG